MDEMIIQGYRVLLLSLLSTCNSPIFHPISCCPYCFRHQIKIRSHFSKFPHFNFFPLLSLTKCRINKTDLTLILNENDRHSRYK